MVNFGQGYNPPGVYIEEDATPLAANPIGGLPSQRVVLIGQAVGKQSRTAQIVLGTTAVVLPDRGIDTATLSVTSVATSTLLAPAEYTATKGSPPQDGSARDYTTTITAATDKGPVWVTYSYTTPDYFEPTLMDSLDDIVSKYGAPFASDPSAAVQVTSPITLAAMLAFANGAAQIVMAPYDSATTDSTAVRTAIQAVYNRISTSYGDSIVVPIPSGMSSQSNMQSAIGDLAGHLNTASTEGYFRVGVIGFPVTTPPVLPTGLGITSPRVMLAYAAPGGLQIFNSTTGQALTVGHEYLGAALAGRMAYLPVQKSLTREQMAGFSGIVGKALSSGEKNSYSAAGVTVLESDRTNRLIVRHAVSTDPSNLFSTEVSLTRARDAMISVLQSSLDQSGLIGDPIDANTTVAVKTIAAGALELCKGQDVIVDYSNLQVRQASAMPSVVEVRFSYKPSFPLNFITVTFSVDLSMSTDAAITDVTETNSVA